MIWMIFVGSAVVLRNWDHIYIPTVVRLLPPLNVTEQEMGDGLARLERAVQRLVSAGG